MRKKSNRKNKVLIPYLLLIAILIISSVLLATLQLKTNLPSQPITSAFMISNVIANLNITGELTGGGNNISIGSIKVKASVGQTVVGVANNTVANIKVCFGISCKIGPKFDYTVNFTGQLNYSNRTAISNGLITAYITYLTNTYSQRNTTDSNGNFLVVVKTPNLQNLDFNVKFYVESDIEATYECRYDHITEDCNPI